MERVANRLVSRGIVPAIGGTTGTHLPASNARIALPGTYAPDPNDSSSRSGHTLGTPIGVEMTDRRGDLTPLIGVVAFCGALALVGLGLGGWALHAQAAPAVKAIPSVAPSSRSVPPIRSEPSAVPSPEPPVSTASDESPPPRPQVSPSVHPVVAPAPSPPAPKNSCDPPYTTDEQGHRHYKMQCLDK